MSDSTNIPSGILGRRQVDVDETSNAVANANNYLCLRLYNALSSEEPNVFFSPLSISIAFAMLYRGADGISAQEMRSVLGYDRAEIDDSTLHDKFGQLVESTKANSEHLLCIANAFLCHIHFALLPDYKKDVECLYAASVREVDFAKNSPLIVKEINEWVKDKTHNKIETLFESLDPDTVSVLLNAVYFKGFWNIRFHPKNTKEQPFYNFGQDSKAKVIPMMYVKNKFFFLETESYKAIELPYKGEEIVMVIILPCKRDGLAEIENALSSGTLDFSNEQFHFLTVKVHLPKFNLDYKKELNAPLQSLGMGSIFSQSDANFQKMSRSQIFVSQVLHKATLEVNEEGTVAAAVTGVAMNLRCLVIDMEFVADHPFIFTIVDKKKELILFMGRVNEL